MCFDFYIFIVECIYFFYYIIYINNDVDDIDEKYNKNFCKNYVCEM